MSLKIISVVCSLIVLFTTGQIATAGPAIPAAQKELMEAMKSGDNARIQKAMKALADQRGTSGNAGRPSAHNNGGMPPLSVEDQKLIASPHGKQILANHMQLLKANSREASDIESKAVRSKAIRDWHKQNPKETREPTQAEIYKPMMLIGVNPQLREVAIVGYESERLLIVAAKAEELAREQAKSKTPTYDKLSPDEKLAVEWGISAAYVQAHDVLDLDTLARIYNINGNHLSSEVRHSIDEFNASPQASAGYREVKGYKSSGGGITRIYEESPEYIGADAVRDKRSELARAAVRRHYNPEAFKKWRQTLLERFATSPELLSNFKRGQAYERYVKEQNAAVEWPTYTDNWYILINNNFERDDGRLLRENIDTVIQRSIVEKSGCLWTKGLGFYYAEKHPSSLCDVNGKALPP